MSKKEFKNLGIDPEYYQPERDKNGSRGCFTSHVNVIKQAYEEGCQNILVFEDDIFYSGNNNLKQAIKFMKNENWDIFYLGCIPSISTNRSYRTNYSGVYKIKGLCTHAYVLNRESMRKIKDLTYTGITIDYYYMDEFKNSYAVYPNVFLQGLSVSDISDKWWAGYSNKKTVKLYNRCVEMYSYYVKYPLVVIVPLIILVTAWFICGMHHLYPPLALLVLTLGVFLIGVWTF